MNAKLDTTAAAAATDLKARALATGAISALAYGVSTQMLTALLTDMAAEEFNDSIADAAAALWSMDEIERLEALGLAEDDEKSYLAAKYAVAA